MTKKIKEFIFPPYFILVQSIHILKSEMFNVFWMILNGVYIVQII